MDFKQSPISSESSSDEMGDSLLDGEIALIHIIIL